MYALFGQGSLMNINEQYKSEGTELWSDEEEW